VGQISLAVNSLGTAVSVATSGPNSASAVGGALNLANVANFHTYRALHVTPWVEFFLLLSNIVLLIITIMFLSSLFDDPMKPSALGYANMYKWINFVNPTLFIKFCYIIYAGVDKEIKAIDTWKEGLTTLCLVWLFTLIWSIVNGVAGMLYSKRLMREGNTGDYQAPEQPDQGYYLEEQNPEGGGAET